MTHPPGASPGRGGLLALAAARAHRHAGRCAARWLCAGCPRAHRVAALRPDTSRRGTRACPLTSSALLAGQAGERHVTAQLAGKCLDVLLVCKEPVRAARVVITDVQHFGGAAITSQRGSKL